jgi:hypothetical protein
MQVVRPKINFTGTLRVMSVTYTAVLPIAEATAYDYPHETIDVLAAQARTCTTRCWRPKPPGTSTSAWTAP